MKEMFIVGLYVVGSVLAFAHLIFAYAMLAAIWG